MYRTLYLLVKAIYIDRHFHVCRCCSHINSHNQIRGHRTGSSHSGAEEYPREKTQTKGGTRIYHSWPNSSLHQQHIKMKSGVSLRCARSIPVHTSHYSRLEKPTIPLATEERLPRIIYIYIYIYIYYVVPTTTHTRQAQVNRKNETKKRNEDKGKERKDKKAKERSRKEKKRKEKSRKARKDKTRRGSKERKGQKKWHTSRP